MKEITLPKELLNLPQPWASTHPDQRRQQLRSLSYDKSSIKTALNVLERSLHSLSLLTYSKTNCIPEEMITYWDFSVQWFAESIPTLDDFNLVKIKQVLICDEGIDSPSPDLIFDVAGPGADLGDRGVLGLGSLRRNCEPEDDEAGQARG